MKYVSDKETKKGKYFKTCEREYLDILNEYEKLKEEGFSMLLSFVFPKCDIDGTFQPVQENITQ